MINGPMSEAQKGCATLQDVDRGTFIRFIQWAYTGQYFAAEFTQDQSPGKSTELTVQKKNKKSPGDMFPTIGAATHSRTTHSINAKRK